jgi:hypothetical protein
MTLRFKEISYRFSIERLGEPVLVCVITRRTQPEICKNNLNSGWEWNMRLCDVHVPRKKESPRGSILERLVVIRWVQLTPLYQRARIRVLGNPFNKPYDGLLQRFRESTECLIKTPRRNDCCGIFEVRHH